MAGQQNISTNNLLIMLLIPNAKCHQSVFKLALRFFINPSDSTSAKPLKAPKEEDMQKVTGRVAHAKEISMVD